MIKITLKHMQGQHTQKRHGWRYGYSGWGKEEQIQHQGLEEYGLWRQRQRRSHDRTDRWNELRRQGYRRMAGDRKYHSGKDILSFQLLDKIGRWQKGGQDVLTNLIKMQGFDGLPGKVNREEMDDIFYRGQAGEAWRGVREHLDKNGEVVVGEQGLRQYMNGKLYVGAGVYGDGTYASNQRSTAENYGDTLMRLGLRKGSNLYAENDGKKIHENQRLKEFTGTVTKNYYRALDHWKTTQSKYGVDSKQTAAALKNVTRWSKRNEIITRILDNPSNLAIAMGFDAIIIPQGAAEWYAVILNRTATIVQDELYYRP